MLKYYKTSIPSLMKRCAYSTAAATDISMQHTQMCLNVMAKFVSKGINISSEEKEE